MRPWTIDADDIHVATDFDTELLHKTPLIEDYLDNDRDDKFIVVGTKGFGKTLVLKAKRIAYQEAGHLCLPQGTLLDKPIGDKVFRREINDRGGFPRRFPPGSPDGGDAPRAPQAASSSPAAACGPPPSPAAPVRLR